MRDSTRHEVFPVGRREQHASRVLHPGIAARSQRDLEPASLPGFVLGISRRARQRTGPDL